MTACPPRTGDVSTGRIFAFTIGELGVHVPFMSIVLFLMFFYTDAVGLSPATAGLIFMIASVWDGLIDVPIAALADRTRTRWGKYRPYILLGAIPLAVSYVTVFYRPQLDGVWLVAFMLGTHMLFRTCFALVGIPYSSLSARITSASRTRTTIAALKLFFTIGSACIVAYFTLPLVRELGGEDAAGGFFRAALVFAVFPLVFLPIVFLSAREQELPTARRSSPSFAEYLKSYRSNLAFWIVLLCMVCVITSQVAFGTTVLYFFKYYLNDEASAQTALTVSPLAGLVAVPAWMLVERSIGKRNAWFLGAGWGLLVLGYFAARTSITSLEFILLGVLLNCSFYGLSMTMWSMLPDTVEYGEWRSGVRAESMSFGIATLVLKVAMGAGSAVFGAALQWVGFVPNQVQSPATLAGIKAIMAFAPITLLAISVIAVLFYPMRRGDHERIVGQLAARQEA